MSDQTLARRVAGSLMAVELASLIASSDIEDADYMDGLLDRLNRDFGQQEITDVADVKPEPIARLGKTIMPFGQYKDNSFDDIPLEYLDWLCRSQEDFYRNLRAYLKHPDVEARRA